MADDTYYISPHEAALAVVATSMKKSRLPFYILVINSIIGAFLFSAGGMLYVMCEAGSAALIPGMNIFVYLAQGAVYAIGLFYVIVCGMELFNSNILFFSVGVMRGAVTLMDLIISWFVSFWVNFASTVFVVYVICYCSGVLKQEEYVTGTIAIAKSKDSYTFAESLLKGIAGNFFVCLAVYLQIMVKPLHVKFLMIFLPIFTFVAMGFSHVVADMFLVPAGIFNNCGYGFGHYFWKIMLPGAIGNIIGGSFFGVVIPWYLHLVVIEQDMKKLNLPAYDERDEQPMLNMESRVVRVPTQKTIESSSVQEFKPDYENSISRVPSNRSAASTVYNSGMSRISTATSDSVHLRTSKKIRSPRGVFPVVDMGEPLKKEKTIAGPYVVDNQVSSVKDLDSLVEPNNTDNNHSKKHNNNDSICPLDDDDVENPVSIFSGNDSKEESNSVDDGIYEENSYDPEREKVSAKLMRAISRTVTRQAPTDLEKGVDGNNSDKNDGRDPDTESNLVQVVTHTAANLGHELKTEVQNKIPKSPPKPKTRSESKSSISSNPVNKVLKHFTFGGGGNDSGEIHRRLSEAKITRKAAGMSNDIAGIHETTLDGKVLPISKRKRSVGKGKRNSVSGQSVNGKKGMNILEDSRLGGPYSNDKWKHFAYDYELDSERPVSFISEKSENEDTSDNDEKNNDDES